MISHVERSDKRRIQRSVLLKYRACISVRNDVIAIEAGTSLESVRRTILGVQAHPGVLMVLRKLFLEVPEWNGVLPRDLYNFITDPR